MGRQWLVHTFSSLSTRKCSTLKLTWLRQKPRISRFRLGRHIIDSTRYLQFASRIFNSSEKDSTNNAFLLHISCFIFYCKWIASLGFLTKGAKSCIMKNFQLAVTSLSARLQLTHAHDLWCFTYRQARNV